MDSKSPITLVLLGVIPLLAVGGCTTLGMKIEPGGIPTPVAVATEVTELYSAAGQIIPTKGQPPLIEAVNFADAGYRIVDRTCVAYFDSLLKASNRLKMTKADVTALGTAAAVIATLAKAAPKEIGIVAATFGLGATVLDNVQQYAFATPYPSQTRTLVLKALAVYRTASPPTGAQSLDDAADRIAGYARLCTYSGISQLSEQAIAAGKPVDTNQPEPLFSSENRNEFLEPVAKLVGLASADKTPADNDFVILAAIANPATNDPEQLKKLVAMFTAKVNAETVKASILDGDRKVSSTLDQIWIFLQQLINGNAAFAARVEAVKSATATGSAGVRSTPTSPPAVPRSPIIEVK